MPEAVASAASGWRSKVQQSILANRRNQLVLGLVVMLVILHSFLLPFSDSHPPPPPELAELAELGEDTTGDTPPATGPNSPSGSNSRATSGGLSKLWNGVLSLGKHGPQPTCSQLPVPDDFWYLSGPPTVKLAPPKRALSPGDSVCVRVVVPPAPHNVSHFFIPLPGAFWDSIILDLVGERLNVSVTAKLKATPDLRNHDRESVHIYEADVVLRDPDVYRPEGILEHRNAEWNPEIPMNPLPYDAEPLEVSGESKVTVVDDRASPYSLHNYLSLPLCTSTAVEGRWIRQRDLPFSAAVVPGSDNHGRVWLPYSCRMRRVPYEEFVGCLREKYPLTHWYGDSNTRRSLKKISTLGKWCSLPEEQFTRECICEDQREPFTRFNAIARNNLIELDERLGGMSDTSEYEFRPGNIGHHGNDSVRIFFHKWDGLVTINKPHWDMDMVPEYINPYGSPDLLIIALTNWDAAFSTFVEFSRELSKMIQRVDGMYANSTDILIRTGQYFCCSADMTSWHRRFTRDRNRLFDKHVLDQFRDYFGDRRKVSLWDVASVTESRPLSARKEAQTCVSNHVRSEVVEVENQLLFNAMCNWRADDDANADDI